MINKKLLLVVLILSGINIFPSDKSWAQNIPVVVVLRSKDILPYNNAILGFKDELSKSSQVVFEEFNLESYSGSINNLTDQINQKNPQIIFAVGTEAALFAKIHFEGIPVIFSMVLNPVESGIVNSMSNPDGHVTGVSLRISIEQQFLRLKESLPNLVRIGMLYDARNMTQSKEEAQRAADKLGLTLIAKPVYSKSEVGKALNDVIKESDVLWAGVDALIYNSQSSQNILLSTLRNKIPFMAFSSNYVNAGALMALECDYEDIGRQAAQMVHKILKGADVKEMPIDFPRLTRVVVNEKTAKLIGVKIKKALLR